jgi:hypothetical protein
MPFFDCHNRRKIAKENRWCRPPLEDNIHPKLHPQLLGHSSVNLAIKTYSHFINPMNNAAVDTLDTAVRQQVSLIQ